jgi:hypothetical protein
MSHRRHRHIRLVHREARLPLVSTNKFQVITERLKNALLNQISNLDLVIGFFPLEMLANRIEEIKGRI